MARPRIGFIGIGMMGHGIAKNLAAKGFPLAFLVHRDRSRIDDLLAAGARELRTAADLARESDIVMLCVSGSPQVEANVHGENGILAAARSGLTVIDMTTAEPGSTAKIRDALAAKGAVMIDAPLGRTPKHAEEGKLTAMVGASEGDFARVKPVFDAFCEHVFHVGPPGAGHTLKLVNNFMALTIAASIGEAFAVAAKAGVRLDRLFEVASQSAYNTQIFQMLAGNAIKGDLDGFKFSIRNAAKDLRYYTHLAESLPVASYIGEAVHQSYNQAVAMGLGDRLLGAMIEAQEKANAVTILPKRS